MDEPPSSKSSSSDRFVVAQVIRAVGTKGEVEVFVHSDDPGRFQKGSVLHTDSIAITVETSRKSKKGLVVQFAEIKDRVAAESFRAQELFVGRNFLRVLGLGEYWDFELVGCAVETADGRPLGTVTDVIHAPGNDVLVVGDRLIPLISQAVASVSVADHRIILANLPGLLD